MIVVADTSPLNYLILLDRIDIPETLYGRILIPSAVHEEMSRAKAPLSVKAWARNPPRWLDISSPVLEFHSFSVGLDRGEAEAIVLAEELHTDWLLIDEADGRDEATQRGIRTIGTLGILREAHRVGLLNLPEEIHRLRSLRFRVSQSLIRLLLDSI